MTDTQSTEAEVTEESTVENETLAETLSRKMNEFKDEAEEDIVEDVADSNDDEVADDEESEDTEDIASQDDTGEVDDSALFDAPKDWSKEEQEQFESLPDEHKEIVKKRYESMRKDYLSKTESIAGVKKDAELWEMIFDDSNKAALEANGMNAQQYVSGLMEWDKAASSNPAGAIKSLMQHLNVSAEDLGLIVKGETSDDDLDFDFGEKPEPVKQAEITSNKAVDNTVALERQVLEFQYAVGEDKQLLHPHFNDEAMADMEVLLRTGNAKSLDEAYQKSPTVRGILLNEEAPIKKESLSSIKKKTAKAKKAAGSVTNKSASSVKTDYSGLSQKEVLSMKFRQASG